MVRTLVPRLAQSGTSAAPGHVRRDVMQAPVDAFVLVAHHNLSALPLLS